MGEAWLDLSSWWAAPGRPGYASEGQIGTSFPWTIAGLAVGAWTLDDPVRAPEAMPGPGIPDAGPALVWFDSVAVTPGGAGDSGFEDGLAHAQGFGLRPSATRTRALFGYHTGNSNSDGASLLLQRGDSLRWLEVDLSSDRRDKQQALGNAGRHRWGFATGLRRGAHGWQATFTQRGAASQLTSGEEQSTHGESGTFGYRLHGRHGTAGVTYARGWDVHESFGPQLVRSRRDAGETNVIVDGTLRGAAGLLSARGTWSDASVRRDLDPGFDARSRDVWGDVSAARTLGEGQLSLSLAGGRQGALARTEVAPTLAYAFGLGDAHGGVFLTRKVTPLWSDLEPGQTPFLQDTWAYGMDAGLGNERASFVRARLWLGRTSDRALIERLPLEDLWLRLGAEADRERYRFGLLSGEGTWLFPHGALGGEGFLLHRTRSPQQPEIDPPGGGIGWIETRFRAFSGDLGVVLRLDATALGVRESESATPRRLPGYVSYGATAQIELADVVVSLRARNLEDVRREQPWIDLATGREAIGTGTDVHLVLTWKMFD